MVRMGGRRGLLREFFVLFCFDFVIIAGSAGVVPVGVDIAPLLPLKRRVDKIEITRPSASAQADLIKTCYKRAGLDLSKPSDRPQFFEAHGTGTPVGDPIEAEAIASAFFPQGSSSTHTSKEGQQKLYVGSIKSVIGHTEGTAGLAALLKAGLAIQNETIPPNLHFNRLNPKIEPFYSNLEVPLQALPWPQAAVRRASVNW